MSSLHSWVVPPVCVHKACAAHDLSGHSRWSRPCDWLETTLHSYTWPAPAQPSPARAQALQFLLKTLAAGSMSSMSTCQIRIALFLLFSYVLILRFILFKWYIIKALKATSPWLHWERFAQSSRWWCHCTEVTRGYLKCVQFVEFQNFDIDALMNTQYIEKSHTSTFTTEKSVNNLCWIWIGNGPFHCLNIEIRRLVD